MYKKKKYLYSRFLEPLVPSYLYRKLEAFKNGARSGLMAECHELRCSLSFFG